MTEWASDPSNASASCSPPSPCAWVPLPEPLPDPLADPDPLPEPDPFSLVTWPGRSSPSPHAAAPRPSARTATDAINRLSSPFSIVTPILGEPNEERSYGRTSAGRQLGRSSPPMTDSATDFIVTRR